MIPADWSNLPVELLGLIASRLPFALDYVRFGMVCRSWRRVVVENGSSPPSFLPWLMLSQKINSDLRGVCYPYKNRAFYLHLPELNNKRCWGSPFGWVVTLDSNFQLRLLNPLSRAQLMLPPLHKCPNLKNMVCSPKSFRNRFVYKAALSSSPLSLDFVVLAIYSDNEKMAILKAGSHTWTPLECCPGYVDDAICFDGIVYIVSSSGEIVICDCQGSVLQKIIFTPLQEEVVDPEYIAAYLVEIDGQIYVLCRLMFDTRNNDTPFHPYLRTKRFDVYKLDLGNGKWYEIQSLGDWSIFIGNNHSFSICTNEYPECDSNCIYFTDDYSGVSHNTPTSYDTGVYNLETRKIQWLAQDDISVFSFSVPVWFKPSLS
ncbi:PREDICTED: putative F-box protein At1g65770 [Ipomoea nil]|uniref:putative F-box protein At1g65770 n=1 Tax=Ipomoea nil TaxID=35883 RepID=UPI00090094E4|nr:PREDICTED: putative F-box protein At1g65770 [Ipomoea nil]XP_019187793.1 PREDICTED: putative F-box protein At1g65770 [Ipomoea nil]XP_019187794.1 PREDICTED: putative F-box protein At1g65770 [Ipomoea nil]